MSSNKNGFLKTLRGLISKKSGGLCWYCGQILSEVTIDHFIPNGSDEIDNLVPACRPCNSAKSDYDIEGFRRVMSHSPFTDKQVAFLNRNGIVIPEPDYVFWFERKQSV